MKRQLFKRNAPMRELIEEAKGYLNLLAPTSANALLLSHDDVSRKDCHRFFELAAAADESLWTSSKLVFFLMNEASSGYNDARWKVVDATAPNPADWIVVVQHSKGKQMNRPGRYARYTLSDYFEGVPESGRWIDRDDGPKIFDIHYSVIGEGAVLVLAFQVAQHEVFTDLARGI